MMRSWLILLVAFTASEAAKNCVTETDRVLCTCVDHKENTIFISQHRRSENGKWANEVATADPSCSLSSNLQWLGEIYEGSRSHEEVMIRKGYVRRGDSLYKFHNISRTWENARRKCEEEGAHLAIINSESEAGFLQELFRRHPKLYNVQYVDYVFLGFHDLYNEGEYLTIFGKPINKTGYSTWDKDQPNNYGNGKASDPGQDCGSMHRDGVLNDLHCDYLHAFICELEDNPAPFPDDIDYSAGKYKGLEKVIEQPPGTVPRTDAGEGYEFFPGIGFYRLHSNIDVWENARRTCEKEGAHLAIVNSESEAQVLSLMFKQRRVNAQLGDFAFIGFHDQFSEGEYLTIYGEPLTTTGYYRWTEITRHGTPTKNYDSGWDCGGFHMKGGYADLPCNAKYAFFCEKELLQ